MQYIGLKSLTKLNMSNRFGVQDWYEPPHHSLCVGNTILAEFECLTILYLGPSPDIWEASFKCICWLLPESWIFSVRSHTFIMIKESMLHFRYFVLPLLEYCSSVRMSASARGPSLLDRVARGGRFLFPESGSYDMAHRRMISCLSLFQVLF